MSYRIKHKALRRGDEVFPVGSLVEPAEAELSAFPHIFEEAPEAAVASPPSDDRPRRGRPPRVVSNGDDDGDSQ